jgi:predicted dehydrogenase
MHALAAQAAGFEVVGFAGTHPGRTAEFARLLGGQAIDLAALPGGADIVVFVGQSPEPSVAQRVLGAGAHVVIAGSLAESLADADALVALAATAPGRMHWVNPSLYAQVVWAMLVRRKALGPPTYIEVRANDPAAFRAGKETPAELRPGALSTVGVHTLALALVLAAPAVVVSVSATVGRTHSDQPDAGAQVTLTFDSGLRAVVIVSADPLTGAMCDAQMAGATGVVRAEIIPTPSLELNGELVPTVRGHGELAAVEDYGFLALHQALIAQPLRLGYSSSVPFGRLIVALTAAAYQSAASGLPVAFG